MNLELEAYEGELNDLRVRDSYHGYEIAEAESELHALRDEIDRLNGLIEAYNKIFTHNLVPDKGFYYFVCGELGTKDDNNLPEKLMVCPSYGCDWFQVYERTDKTGGTEW